MSSPRHHVIDVEPSRSAGEAGTRPAANSTLAKNLQDQLTITGRKQDPDGREPVIKNNAEPTRDGGRPRLAPIFFVEAPDDTPIGDTDIQRNIMIGDAHFRRVAYSGEILEICSQCKRKLTENADVYMYGYDLGEYCSVDCRRKRMALDGYNVEAATTSDGGDPIEHKQSSRCQLS